MHVPLMDDVQKFSTEIRPVVCQEHEVLNAAEPVCQIRPDTPAARKQNTLLFDESAGSARFVLELRDIFVARGREQVTQCSEFLGLGNQRLEAVRDPVVINEREAVAVGPVLSESDALSQLATRCSELLV